MTTKSVTKSVVKGSMIAAMAAGMFISMTPATSSAGDAAKVHCQGVNSCKGKGACNSASNSCGPDGLALDPMFTVARLD